MATLATYAPAAWYVDGPEAIAIAKEQAWPDASVSVRQMYLYSAGCIDAECTRNTFDDGDPTRGLDPDHPIVVVHALVDQQTRGAVAVDGRSDEGTECPG